MTMYVLQLDPNSSRLRCDWLYRNHREIPASHLPHVESLIHTGGRLGGYREIMQPAHDGYKTQWSSTR